MWKPVGKPSKPIHGSQKCRAITLASIVLILTTYILIIIGKLGAQFVSLTLNKSSIKSPIEFSPSVEHINGTDVIWQVPDSPKAVLFVAHGCNGKAANFWDQSPSCPSCIGLPEERLLVLRALDRRFAVVTISSHGRCWSFGKEKEIVKWIIKRWVERRKLEKLPLVALGASSGGHFVSALAAEMKFSSIVIMIAQGVFETMKVPRDYPPTLFVHMPKDRTRMELIKMNMEALRQKGVHVKEVKCMDFPLTPNLFFERIPGIDKNFSVKLFELFRQKGFINENGYMRNDGRATRWKQALKEEQLAPEESKWFHHIQEELNLAFGFHEMTSLQSDDIFDWFESHLSWS